MMSLFHQLLVVQLLLVAVVVVLTGVIRPADGFTTSSSLVVVVLPRRSLHAHHHHHQQLQQQTSTSSSTVLNLFSSSATTTSTTSLSTTSSSSSSLRLLGRRIPINEQYPGLHRIHTNPDVYVIEDFLDASSCQQLMDKAANGEKTMEQSPVAYSGWTQDFQDLVELATKGPVTWLAIGMAWWQTTTNSGNSSNSQVDLVVHMVQNFGILFVVAVILIGLFTKSRADGLQALRTSTSTTIDDLSSDRQGIAGAANFVRNAAILFSKEDNNDNNNNNTNLKKEASLFEAPTVIRYEPGQVLAPHFDANRSAETEDANRGGQTLATLLVYLNDVEKGGLTRFGKLVPPKHNPDLMKYCAAADGEEEDKLAVRPKRGDALLFFPADANGQFDDRTEHEGCPAIDEKWIARIWRHAYRVPPPFGLSEEALNQI